MDTRKKLYGGLQDVIAGCFSAVLALILWLLLFVQPHTSYYCKVGFLLSNKTLVCIGILAIGLVGWFISKQRKQPNTRWEQHPYVPILILSAALFLVQVVVFYNMYFCTGWDVRRIVDAAIELQRDHQVAASQSGYFSMYPNNVFLVWVLSKIFGLVGARLDLPQLLYVAIVVLSAGATLTGMLLFSIVKKVLAIRFAYGAWLIFVVHVGLSPWITIPYSDAFGLCLPMLMLWLYLNFDEGKIVYFKWAAIGFLAYMGLKIKPQVVIVFIAIAGIEVVHLLANFDKCTFVAFCKRWFVAGLAILLAMLLYVGRIVPSLGLELNPNIKFGLSHFLMMGLNDHSDGGYWDPDVSYSVSFPTPAERQEGNWKMIGERLQAYGPQRA